MSLNILPLETVNQVDIRTRVNNIRKYGVLQGPQQVTYKHYPSSTFSLSQFEITCNPPSRQTLINAKVWLKASVTLDFVGTVSGGNTKLLNIGTYDAPRSYPLSQCLSTLQATIENDTFTANVNQYWSALLRYKNDVEQRGSDYSMTPSMLDQYSEYAQGVGSSRNPLGLYKDTTEREMARGGFSGLVVNSNSATGANVTIEVTEPVFMSPFYFGMGEQSAFVGIENMSLSGVFGNLARFWSHGANPLSSITTVTPTLNSIEALFLYMTPKIVEPIPSQLSWPYYEITSYPTQVGIVAANTSSLITSNAIQLKCIPECLYVFIRERNADLQSSLGYTKTDTFAEITNVNLTFNNISGILATQTPQDLYQMCVSNGLNLSYEQFRGSVHNTGSVTSDAFVGSVGSVVKIAFGKDIGLASDLSCGVNGTYQLSMDVSFRNISRVNAINFDLYIVSQTPGAMSMINGSVLHQVGLISREDVLLASQKPEVLYVVNRDGPLYGGGFWDSLKSVFGKVRDAGSKLLGYVPDALKSQAKDYATAAFKKQFGGGVVGGKMRKKTLNLACKPIVKKRKAVKKKGKGLTGGELLSRYDLASNMGDLSD